MRFMVALLAIALTAAPATAAPERHLRQAEMEGLARAAVHAICPALPRGIVSFEVTRRDGYVVFEAIGHLPGAASVHPCQPFYVIDPATGDMWDGVSECGAVTSPAIRRLQAQLRGRIGLSSARHAQIRRRGPMC